MKLAETRKMSKIQEVTYLWFAFSLSITGEGKDRADYKLMSEMFFFAMRNRKATLIILVAGNDDFTRAMETLKQLGYKIVSSTSGSIGK